MKGLACKLLPNSLNSQYLKRWDHDTAVGYSQPDWRDALEGGILVLTYEAAINTVLQALDSITNTGEQTEITPNADTILIGRSAVLASLELVSLVLEIESRLADDYGLVVTLTDERAFSQTKSPFRTPAALAEYIVSLGQPETVLP